jgi:L-ascorbate metabolism protein UlaG (beta-lactamase superfamily)
VIKYDIIGSSSAGNSVRYFDEILIDVGLPYVRLAKYLKPVRFILLTHAHGDHFQLATINRIAKERPDILWLVPEYLISKIEPLKLRNIIGIRAGKKYKVDKYKIEAVELFHDISNVGYKITKDGYKMIHATDTVKIDHVEAYEFDLYAIEHNYNEDDVYERIISKQAKGMYAHEVRSLDSHLSFQKAQDWIDSQKKESSEVIRLHVSSVYINKEENENG